MMSLRSLGSTLRLECVLFPLAPRRMSDFATQLIDWHHSHGRHDLPWQGTCDAYRIWLSEIMLQQTQVETVIPYYLRFLARFPDLPSLAAAPVEDVMPLWSGLGYYARARNLHECARAVMTRHGGRFPSTAAEIAELPGIGRSTAAAISAFSNGERVPILDGNVKRVLCRVFGVEGFPGEKAIENRLWALAESLLPVTGIATYIQAQMDLGATLCTRSKPACERCPMSTLCVARRDGRTAQLPSARPRKTVPKRSARFAVILDGNAVLLERRPPSGIWGGLLALPEIPEDADAAQWARARYGLKIAAQRPLAALKHVFTHFTLDIQPELLHTSMETPRCREEGPVWQALDDLADAALPAPVRRILQALPSEPPAD